MLYLVGGASRSGKSTVARRLLLEQQVPYLPLDVLVTSLRSAMPRLKDALPEPARERAEFMAPIMGQLAGRSATSQDQYCLEGDLLLPRDVMIHVERGARAVFLGYADYPQEALLREVMETAQPGTWVHARGRESMAVLLAEHAQFSRWLRQECEELGLPYIERRADHAATLAAALEALTAPAS